MTRSIHKVYSEEQTQNYVTSYFHVVLTLAPDRLDYVRADGHHV